LKKPSLVAAGVAVVVLGGIWLTWRPSIAPVAPDAVVSFDDTSVLKGAQLATLANCMNCHTAQGKAPFSGGRAMDTPFGTIYASNLTPDRDTGIGTWSLQAFQRAMRDGVDREGRHLYPAFPYDHFTHVTDADSAAIYAYLMSNPAVKNQIPANDLEFPFNIRPLVAGWKFLFLNQDKLEADPSQGELWTRGRYLVEGLGHCSSCHTPRNAMGAEERGSLYSGGLADDWVAPALDASVMKAHKWTVDDMTAYLTTGWSARHGVAAGPMAEVAQNLGRLSQDDVRAMSTYLVSFSAGAEPPKPAVPQNVPATDDTLVVRALFDGACVACHTDNRDVGPSKALPFGINTMVHANSSANAVRAIMQGIDTYRTDGGPYMPPFGQAFTDEQIVALTKYVRARYSQQPPWDDVESEVAKVRQEEAKQ